MRIIILTIFLTLLNNVRAVPSQACLDSFSYNGQPVTVADDIAEAICDNFNNPIVYDYTFLDCGTEYQGKPFDKYYKFVRVVRANITLRLDAGFYCQPSWNGNKFWYLNSSGEPTDLTARTDFPQQECEYSQTFDDLEFATYTVPGTNEPYIVLRYDDGGQDERETFYKFENCQLCDTDSNFVPDSNGDCQECGAGEVPNSEGTACVCDTASNFVPDSNGDCQACGVGATPTSDGLACECTENGYFGDSGNCALCDATNVNKVNPKELCYLSGGSNKIISLEELQDIQNSLSTVTAATGECPISVE